MALKIIGNMNGNYHGKIIDHLYMTDNEAAEVGQAFYLSSGRWTKSATTAAIEAICIKASAGGTNVLGVMELVLPGTIIEADYTGTANAAFLPGMALANLDANGKNVDATKVADGHAVVYKMDTGNKKVQIVPKKTFCCA